MSIPKKIHYCWFGRGEKSELILKCIESWKKFLPDYEIIEWNEDSFDINSHPFTKLAYESKSWAYLTDYVRAYAIYNHGGVYFDTDVEIVQSIDKFLEHRAFTGFESKYTPFTAVFGAEKHHPWVKDILDIYNTKDVYTENGELSKVTNTVHVSSLLINKYNIKPNNKYQTSYEDLHIYPSTYFCRPCKKNNYSIHHCNGSWVTGRKKTIRNLTKLLLGNKLALKVMDIKSNILFGLGIKKV